MSVVESKDHRVCAGDTFGVRLDERGVCGPWYGKAKLTPFTGPSGREIARPPPEFPLVKVGVLRSVGRFICNNG